jgi:hypothetical protein
MHERIVTMSQFIADKKNPDKIFAVKPFPNKKNPAKESSLTIEKTERDYLDQILSQT